MRYELPHQRPLTGSSSHIRFKSSRSRAKEKEGGFGTSFSVKVSVKLFANVIDLEFGAKERRGPAWSSRSILASSCEEGNEGDGARSGNALGIDAVLKCAVLEFSAKND